MGPQKMGPQKRDPQKKEETVSRSGFLKEAKRSKGTKTKNRDEPNVQEQRTYRCGRGRAVSVLRGLGFGFPPAGNLALAGTIELQLRDM